MTTNILFIRTRKIQLRIEYVFRFLAGSLWLIVLVLKLFFTQWSLIRLIQCRKVSLILQHWHLCSYKMEIENSIKFSRTISLQQLLSFEQWQIRSSCHRGTPVLCPVPFFHNASSQKLCRNIPITLQRKYKNSQIQRKCSQRLCKDSAKRSQWGRAASRDIRLATGARGTLLVPEGCLFRSTHLIPFLLHGLVRLHWSSLSTRWHCCESSLSSTLSSIAFSTLYCFHPFVHFHYGWCYQSNLLPAFRRSLYPFRFVVCK